MPGRMDSMARSGPSSRSAKPGTSGRGPTRLMCPAATFNSCGSSSILSFLKTCPTRVIRASVLAVTVVVVWEADFIERSFSSLNSSPCLPTRCWINRPFWPVDSVAAHQPINMMGHRKKIPTIAPNRSMLRFKNRCTGVKTNGSEFITQPLQPRTGLILDGRYFTVS